MDIKGLKTFLLESILDCGLERNRSSLYLTCGDVLIVVDLQKSQYSNGYYINVGYVILSLYKGSGIPKAHEGDIRTRFSWLPSGKNKKTDLYDVESLCNHSQGMIKKNISDNVENLINLVCESGLKKLLEKHPELAYLAADKSSASYNAAFADLQATLEALGHPKLDVEALGAQPTLEGYYPELLSGSAQAAPMAKGALESTSRVLFWYHPDYLGNVDLVTERDGKTYEFFTYNPWGEEMHQYNANTFGFSSPYRFNSKEKDAETGLHYYGARYYQSKLSVWLSVDPKAHWYPNKAPFNFSGNNPLNIIDPNGMWEQDPDGNWVAQKGDSAGSLARDAGISQSAAESIIRDYNSSNNHNRSSDIMVYVGDAVQLPGGNRSLKGQGTESSGITSSSSLAGPRIDIANLTAGANPLSTNSETLYQGISGLRLGNTVKQALIDYAETTGELSKGVSWYMEATKIFDYGLAIAQAHQIEKKFDLGEINNQSRYFEHTVNIGTTALLRNPVYSLAWSFGYDFLGPAVVNTEWYQYRVHGRKPKKSIIID